MGYTREVGRKFNADGSVRRFAETTIISFVDADAPIYRVACWLQEEVRKRPFAHKFGFLPPDSFHMTVMQLLNDQGRAKEQWTSDLSLTASLGEIDAFMIERVPAIAPPTGIQMRFSGIKRQRGMSIQLEPASAAVAKMLHDYREAIATATGIRFPNHDTYRFHISTAYRLIHFAPAEQDALEHFLDEAEQHFARHAPEVHLSSPQLTFFDDMFRFVPVEQRHTLPMRQA